MPLLLQVGFMLLLRWPSIKHHFASCCLRVKFFCSTVAGYGDTQPAYQHIQQQSVIHSCSRHLHGLKAFDDMQISKDLVPINARLAEYVQQWDASVDAWLVIKVADPAYVFRWRQQAETAMKAAGKGGMTDEQVRPSMALSRAGHAVWAMSMPTS